MSADLYPQIVTELQRLHQNNPTAVPKRRLVRRKGELRKEYFPWREKCPECGGWETGPKGKRIPPEKAHAIKVREAVKEKLEEGGATDGEARRTSQSAYEQCLSSHDVPDSPEYWLWHVRGHDDQGREYHRGVYSHSNDDTGIDVIWDFDKDLPDPVGYGRVLVAKLQELGLGRFVYMHKSHGGVGVHVRLCHRPLPSWARKKLGEALRDACKFDQEIEVFPKQDGKKHGQVKNYGNLVGLPAAMHLVPQGRTALLRPSSGYTEVVTSAEETLAILQAVEQATAQDLQEVLFKFKVDLDNPPEKKGKDRGKPKKVSTPRGSYTVYSASDQLTRDIQDRLTPEDFLIRFCGQETTRGGHFHCPTHGGSGHSFSTWINADGVGMWRCHSVCDDSGDVVKLAKLVWRLPWNEARNRLATSLGLDPDSYESKVTHTDGKPVGGDWDSMLAGDEAAEEAPKRKPKIRKAPKEIRAKRLKSLEDWGLKWALDAFPDVVMFTRATARMLLAAGVDPEVTAATLHNRVTFGIFDRYDQVLAEVLEVFARIERGERVVGRGWIRDNLGSQALFELAHLLSRELPGAKLVDMVKLLISFDLVVDQKAPHLQHASYLLSIHKGLSTTEEGRNQYKKILAQLRRPAGCCRFGQKANGYGGRDLGKKKFVCDRVLCTYCKVLKAVSEYELLEEMWTEKVGQRKVRVVEVWGIKDREHVDTIRRKYVSRSGYKKLSLLGYKDRQPTLTWLCMDSAAKVAISSAVYAWRAIEKHRDVKVRTRNVSLQEALDLAFSARISWHVYARTLMEERRTQDLVEWLDWAKGKQTARSTCSVLRWPNKEMLKEHFKKKLGDTDQDYELMPGEVVTYTLLHLATDTVLGRRDKIPFTQDEAMTIYDNRATRPNALAA
jgi:hypothetical protein